MDRGDDHLVGVILGQQSPDERRGVGVFLDAVLLKLVELFAGLAVQVLAVDDEEALVDVVVFLEQCRGFERRQRLAAAGGVPDVAVAAVVIDAFDDLLHGVDLVRPHDHQLLFALDQHHVAADRPAERAFGEEPLGEIIKVADLFVRLVGELVQGQEAFFGVEGEVAGVVIGEVVGAVAIADDEELDEAKERLGVTVAGVIFVIDDLFHRPAGAGAQRLEFDLHDGDAIDQQDDVVAMVAVGGVDAELVDHLEGVFAPILDIDEGEIELRAVVAGEGVEGAKRFGRVEDIGGDEFIEQPIEFGIREPHAIEGFELEPEVRLERRPIADIGAIFVL